MLEFYLGCALSYSKSEATFLPEDPHICWMKWSRICSNSKHSWDITVVTKSLKISQLCCISAVPRDRANLRPLCPTNMGGPQEGKWPQICYNSKHKKVMVCGGGGWGPTTEWRKIPETGHPLYTQQSLVRPVSMSYRDFYCELKFSLRPESCL